MSHDPKLDQLIENHYRLRNLLKDMKLYRDDKRAAYEKYLQMLDTQVNMIDHDLEQASREVDVFPKMCSRMPASTLEKGNVINRNGRYHKIAHIQHQHNTTIIVFEYTNEELTVGGDAVFDLITTN
jgi:hypothetical protein